MPLLDVHGPTNTAPPGGGRAGRVLCVDDDYVFRTLVKHGLERFGGHDVRAIDDDATTLKQAAEFQPDVIVLDARLSQRSGIDLLKELRALPETAATPVMFCTGFAQSEFQDAVRNLDVAAVVSKLDLRQLVVEVQAVLDAARGLTR